MGLDQYAYVTDAKGDRDKTERDFYWRKHSKLQTWMEEKFVARTGKAAAALNCEELNLTAEDIAELRNAVTGKSLPTCDGGFFYGHQFQDETSEEYRAEDLEFCDWADAKIAEGKQVTYSCWW